MSSLSKLPDRLIVLPIFLVLIDIAYQQNAADPLNPIKFWLLGLLAMWAVADLVASSSQSVQKLRERKELRNYAVLLGLFIGFFLMACIVSPVKSTALLGDSGRNLGFLNYLFLAIVGLYASLKTGIGNLKSLYWTAFALTAVLSTYGLLQYYKFDIVHWQNSYNPIILFTGNPDFASALLGMFAVLCFAGIFFVDANFAKFVLIILVIFDGLVIMYSNALQGLVILITGMVFIVFIILRQKVRRIAFGFLGVSLFVAFVSILGMIGKGPFHKYFYKASVVDRGYYWRAAWKMFTSHPWFGVGIDRFNDFFLQYRSARYPLVYGYAQSANNAHNVFLELLATAGIFVGLAYISIVVYITVRGFSAIRNRKGHEQLIVSGIVAAWLVFVEQEFISIDFTAITVWGWVLGAAIVALSNSPKVLENQKNGGMAPKSGLAQRRFTSSFFNVKHILALSLGFIGILLVIIPMYRSETQVARFNAIPSSVASGDPDAYLSEAKRAFNLPLLNPNRKAQIALNLAKNNLPIQSVDFFKKTLEVDPRNANSLSILAILYENLKDYPNAVRQRKALWLLDPFGAENLLSLENDFLIMGNRAEAQLVEQSILGMAPGTDVAKRAANLLVSNLSMPLKPISRN